MTKSFQYYLLLLLQKIVRIKKNRVVFTSFGGHYSDSPKFISMKLYEMHPEIEQVWLVKKEYESIVPDYVKKVNIDSPINNAFYRGSAHVLVDNVYGEKGFETHVGGNEKKYAVLKWLMAKKNQKVVTSWHGTPLKKMGVDQVVNDVTGFIGSNISMVLGNAFTAKVMDKLTFNRLSFKMLGCPRNDIFFASTNPTDKKKLGIDETKRIALYAPTFRSDGNGVDNTNVSRSGINQLNELDITHLLDALKEKFGGDWLLVCRFHYHVEKMVDWDRINKEYGDRVINGNLGDDMSDYLKVTDALITDASSCMFDYALSGKPCFLYFPDVDYYGESERGFYLDIEHLPFCLSRTANDLYASVMTFDEAKYKKEVTELLEMIGSVENGEAAAETARFVSELVENGKH